MWPAIRFVSYVNVGYLFSLFALLQVLTAGMMEMPDEAVKGEGPM